MKFLNNIVGNLTGNADTATKLSSSKTINGVIFDGSSNISVTDSSKLPLAGGTLTGTLSVINGSNGRINIGASNNYIYGDSSNNFIVGTAGSDRLQINSSGNVTVGGTFTASQICGTNNGTGDCFKVGDDAYIGDVNVANTVGVKGIQNANAGYIQFGNSATNFGWDGSSLVFGSNSVLTNNYTGVGEKLYVYNSGNARSGFGQDLNNISYTLNMFTCSPDETTGRLSFGYRNTSSGAYTEKAVITGTGMTVLGKQVATTDKLGTDLTGYYTTQQWRLIGNMPVTASGTNDVMYIELHGGGWNQNQGLFDRIMLSNRDSLNWLFETIEQSAVDRSRTIIEGYTQTDGSVNVYLKLSSYVKGFIKATSSGTNGVGEIAIGSGTTTTPAGTLSWSSSTATKSTRYNNGSFYVDDVKLAKLSDIPTTLPANGGNADTVDGRHFNWSGQSGQPTWLWGGNDATNMYVYNPSNFSVNHATTASTATKLETARTINGVPFDGTADITVVTTTALSAVKYNVAGTYQFTPPTGVDFVYVTMFGSGGGGGGGGDSWQTGYTPGTATAGSSGAITSVVIGEDTLSVPGGGGGGAGGKATSSSAGAGGSAGSAGGHAGTSGSSTSSGGAGSGIGAIGSGRKGAAIGDSQTTNIVKATPGCGGGGGIGSIGNSTYHGGGGGGGGVNASIYSRRAIPVNSSTPIIVNIGAGGAGGSGGDSGLAYHNGGAGGDGYVLFEW